MIDYISPIWLLGLSVSFINKLNVFQKFRGQAIIRAFCKVALNILKSEARFELFIIQ